MLIRQKFEKITLRLGKLIEFYIYNLKNVKRIFQNVLQCSFLCVPSLEQT